MKQLPDTVTAYKTTPVFTQNTIPAGLRKNHRTKAGTWAVIQVKAGELEYTIQDEETYILTPKNPGVVEPGVSHHINPLGQVTFVVEFYAKSGR